MGRHRQAASASAARRQPAARRAGAVRRAAADAGRAGRARARPGRAARRVGAAARRATSTAATSQAIDKAEVEARGRTLVESLESHGVETKLLGQTVGPTVTRYELELGLGRQGRPDHQPQPRHRLRDGRHRRAHPRPDPRTLGDRRRGAEPHPPARRARRHHDVAGGEGLRPPARRRDRQGHRRPLGVPQPRHHPAPAHRRRHRRGQVERHQLHHHVDAHAQHARSGAADPHRPEAGRDGPVQPAAAPADRSRSPTRRRRPTRWRGR